MHVTASCWNKPFQGIRSHYSLEYGPPTSSHTVRRSGVVVFIWGLEGKVISWDLVESDPHTQMPRKNQNN